MSALSAHERGCVERYCTLLRERLGADLVEVRLFGSAARGEMWPAHSPMHSDVGVALWPEPRERSATLD